MASIRKLGENKYKIAVYVGRIKGYQDRKYRTVNCDYETAKKEAEKFEKELKQLDTKNPLNDQLLNTTKYIEFFLNDYCKSCFFKDGSRKNCDNIGCKAYDFVKFIKQKKEAFKSLKSKKKKSKNEVK